MDEDSSRAALDYKLILTVDNICGRDCHFVHLKHCLKLLLIYLTFSLYYFFVVSLGLLTLCGCSFRSSSSCCLYFLWFFGSMDRTETSYTYSQFQKSGRFTAPATVIPRFKNYSVDDFHFLAVLGKGSFGKVSREPPRTYTIWYISYIYTLVGAAGWAAWHDILLCHQVSQEGCCAGGRRCGLDIDRA